MKARDSLNSTMRKAGAVALCGAGTIIVGMVLLGLTENPIYFILLPAGFLVLAAVLVWIQTRVNCRSCGINLGKVFGAFGFFSVPAKIRFCPGCGINLDTETAGS